MTSTSGPDAASDKGASAAKERPALPVPQPTVGEERGFGMAEAGLATAAVAIVLSGIALFQPWLGGDSPPPPDPMTRVQTVKFEQRLSKLEESAVKPVMGADQIKALTDKLAELQQRIDQLPAPQQAAPPDPRIGELDGRLKAVESALTSIGGQLEALTGKAADAGKTAADIEKLSAQVNAFGATIDELRKGSVAAEALVLAAGQLRAALSGDQPFQPELKAARALGKDDAEVLKALDVIAPYAEKGIATRNRLADRFANLAGSIVRAARRGEGGSWVDQVEGAVSTLVTIRRQGGGIVGNTVEAIVARAEAALKNGDLAGSAAELSALDGPAAAEAAPWLAEAKARLAVDDAARTISERAVMHFTAVAGTAAEKTP